jgi:hypothetical protein
MSSIGTTPFSVPPRLIKRIWPFCSAMSKLKASASGDSASTMFVSRAIM